MAKGGFHRSCHRGAGGGVRDLMLSRRLPEALTAARARSTSLSEARTSPLCSHKGASSLSLPLDHSSREHLSTPKSSILGSNLPCFKDFVCH